jgi:hypothetical protein
MHFRSVLSTISGSLAMLMALQACAPAVTSGQQEEAATAPGAAEPMRSFLVSSGGVKQAMALSAAKLQAELTAPVSFVADGQPATDITRVLSASKSTLPGASKVVVQRQGNTLTAALTGGVAKVSWSPDFRQVTLVSPEGKAGAIALPLELGADTRQLAVAQIAANYFQESEEPTMHASAAAVAALLLLLIGAGILMEQASDNALDCVSLWAAICSASNQTPSCSGASSGGSVGNGSIDVGSNCNCECSGGDFPGGGGDDGGF